MKRIRVSELIPGYVTAEDVFSLNNQLVVSQGTILTDELIARLEYYSVLSIRVTDEDPIAQAISGFEAGSSDLSTGDPAGQSSRTYEGGFKDTPPTLSYSERIKATRQFMEFQKSFVENTEALKGNLHDIIANNTINTGVMLQSVTNLISEGTTTIGMFDMLHSMRSYDDLTYVHSMSVSLICNIFAKWLGYKDEDIKIITLSGLLHDIGKLAIPEAIIKKPSKLTNDEYQRIKQHTIEGYKILKKLPIDDRIKDAALLHHERCDGTGYPLGVGPEKIPLFAKIVSIADVYDAMTASRVYRGPMCPFKVISIFEEEGLQKYDSQLILTFLDNVGQTYVNNSCRLSDGREGEIVLIHRNAISRPLIKLKAGGYVDLENEDKKKLFIDELI